MLFVRPLLLTTLTITTASAGEVKIAVASDFTGPMQVISVLFERDTGRKPSLAFGSTGKLALWSADPKRVDAAGEILKNGGFGHPAIGKDKPAAIAPLNYLKSEKAQTVINSFG